MKKSLLLGALLVLGTVANGAILETLVGNTATATVDVIVKGVVKTRIGDTLVVEITQGGNLSGQGFELEMDDLFEGTTTTTSTKLGKYTAKVENTALPGSAPTDKDYVTMEHKLVGGTGIGSGPLGATSTTANNVEINYGLSIIVAPVGNKVMDKGIITVTATTSPTTTAGAYIDATVALEVKVTV